ncbi:MAG: peptidylprolyl isomerase [Bacteroidetes bacterium]|nr:peptidylprolyl isomerase [Bacteroidota bacterium]
MTGRILIIFCITTLQVFGQAPARQAREMTLFSVDGQPMTSEEFIFLFKKNHLKKEDYTQPKVAEYIELLINFRLKVAEARREGIDTTMAFIKEFNTYRNELKKPYLAETNELSRLTHEAYNRLKEEVKASHILISVTPDALPPDTLKAFEKAIELRNRLLKGEEFSKVAGEVSDDPSAKLNGGNLGYFTALQMVYPFEEAAWHLNKDDLSEPVRTRFGYHLIKVYDHRPSRGEVEVSHIILRTGSGDHHLIRNKIFDIHRQLLAGGNWDELCKEYSDDPSTKNSGGRLRPFGVGVMSSVPEFESAAFALEKPGEISDPFQSAYGWHIIRLERKIPIPPYDEIASTLERKVARDERLQLAQEKEFARRKQQNGYRENGSVMTMILQLADSSLLSGKWHFHGSADLLKSSLFELNERPYTVEAFVKFIRQQQTFSQLGPAAYMKQLHNRFVEQALDEAEDAKLRASNDDYRNLIKEYEEGLLLFSVMEKNVWNRASQDTVELKRHYEKIRTKFQAGERLEARIFSTTDQAFLADMKGRIARGDSLTEKDLRKFKSVIPIRRYERNDHPVMTRIPWVTGIQEAELDGTYYLVDVHKLIAPGIKDFSEVKAQVISDYQEDLERRWVAGLRQKYQVKTNGKARKFVVSELAQN